jgi:hypothetical protein
LPSIFAPRWLDLLLQTARHEMLSPGASVRALTIRAVRAECQTPEEPENTVNPSLVELGEIVTDWPLVFWRVSVIKTACPLWLPCFVVVTLAATCDGAGGVGEGVAGAISNVADAPCGSSWFVTAKVPTGTPEKRPGLGDPSHVSLSVNDWPGSSVWATRTMGLTPPFDCQTGAPFWVTSKPSIEGPSTTLSGWLLVLVSVNVIRIGWPS